MTNPTVHWREPGDVSAVLDVPAAGVFLGVDATIGPGAAARGRAARHPDRGGRRLAHRRAARLPAARRRLPADPGDRRTRPLAAPARRRRPPGTVARSGAGWPPPAGGAAHLLVTDLATPPNPAAGTRTPCTVVHVVEQVPPGGPYWSAVDAVLVSGRGHGAALARLLGRDDARSLDAIGPTQLGLLDRNRAVAVTAVLADPERSLLLGR